MEASPLEKMNIKLMLQRIQSEIADALVDEIDNHGYSCIGTYGKYLIQNILNRYLSAGLFRNYWINFMGSSDQELKFVIDIQPYVAFTEMYKLDVTITKNNEEQEIDYLKIAREVCNGN